MPCDYCELGIRKFLNDIERFDFIRLEITNSLVDKVNELGDIEMILPSSITSHFIN